MEDALIPKFQEVLSDAVLLQLAPPSRVAVEVGIAASRNVYGLSFPLELPPEVRVIAEMRAP